MRVLCHRCQALHDVHWDHADSHDHTVTLGLKWDITYPLSRGRPSKPFPSLLTKIIAPIVADHHQPHSFVVALLFTAACCQQSSKLPTLAAATQIRVYTCVHTCSMYFLYLLYVSYILLDVSRCFIVCLYICPILFHTCFLQFLYIVPILFKLCVL